MHVAFSRTDAVRMALVVAEARVLRVRHIEGEHPPASASRCVGCARVCFIAFES